MYAEVIVGLSVEKLDKAFSYKLPKAWEEEADSLIGQEVVIPFGRGGREIKGFIVGIQEKPNCDEKLVKEILRKSEQSVPVESKLIELAYYMREHFGGTMNEALRTVLQVSNEVERKKIRKISLVIPKEEARKKLEEFERKKYVAKERILKKAIEGEFIYEDFIKESNTTLKTFEGLEKEGVIHIKEELFYRKPVEVTGEKREKILLNEEQDSVSEMVKKRHKKGESRSYLLFGITGSGKTEVYIDIMEEVIAKGEQVIFLIPEISLTFQMIERLSARFGERISIMNSRMSKGEKYDQYLRAKEGEIDIIVGPRSALFTPFQNLGLIIVDEEHSESYKSSKTPRYHAREVALKRADIEGADVILGSATPSLETVKMASDKRLTTLTLTKRPEGVCYPKTEIIDLREELVNGNKSIFSRRLKELIEDRLEKKEQIMLFLNRRGYAGFVSCRTCGEPLKCPHCEVSLTFHRPNRLLCHYCGYEQKMPKMCPSCFSPHIKTFGLGTEQAEEIVKNTFPNARVLRMDADTTGGKHGHSTILKAFKEEEADILVGTQMIVKGHDFPKVTLVGILAADLSLFANDYRAAEKTYQLLVQAGGRAGRGNLEGEVIIQTYKPGHYSIVSAATGDYRRFYEIEFRYRRLASYPPERKMLSIICAGKDEKDVERCASLLEEKLLSFQSEEVKINAAVWAIIPKLNDVYRKMIYLKSKEEERLIEIKNFVETEVKREEYKRMNIQFDFLT